MGRHDTIPAINNSAKLNFGVIAFHLNLCIDLLTHTRQLLKPTTNEVYFLKSVWCMSRV